jgi:transcriptional regulator with GAF, ATPase, and Fis domain
MSSLPDQLELTGPSEAIAVVREEIGCASRCDAKVLISGESGVGKEVVARMIHAASARRHHPLVTVNCAALTDSLLETELFGHVRGSFTGAIRDRSGAFEAANRGTVFLDEIGEMTPRMQGLLLRFLETGEIQRVGSERVDICVNVRVLAATNRDLTKAVADKTFREDLYYRVNVFHMCVPPLRERGEDLPLLLSRFLTSFADRYQMPRPAVAPETMALLTAYQWPGNVRELRNVAERLVVRQKNGRIDPSDLPRELTASAPAAPAVAAAAALPRVDALFDALVQGRESFWSVIHAPFVSHDLTRDELRAVVRRGLERTGGNYRVLTELFNMPHRDYKRFLSFLTKHECHVAFQPFRTVGVTADSRAYTAADHPRYATAREKSA